MVSPLVKRVVEVAFVVDAFATWKEPGKMTWFGRERVIAPVAPEVVI